MICLSNLENINSVLINDGVPQNDRLEKLNQIAIQQMEVLKGAETNLLNQLTTNRIRCTTNFFHFFFAPINKKIIFADYT